MLIHNSDRDEVARELNADSTIHDALQPEPDGFYPWLTVAFATKNATQAGDQAHHRVEARWLLGPGLLGQEVSSLPRVGFQQQRGSAASRSGRVRPRRIRRAMRPATTKNSAKGAPSCSVAGPRCSNLP